MGGQRRRKGPRTGPKPGGKAWGDVTADGDNCREVDADGVATCSTRRPPLLENKQFESYYQRQRICPEAEWSEFLAALRSGLPASVRVNRGAHTAEVLLPQLRRLQAAHDEMITYAPRPLSWYPHSLAWQWDELCSWSIKKDVRHRRLKAYLLWLQDHGAITRQEAVSMIPPLCLGVDPGDMILDLCAAPGSKTSQMLEMMHWPSQEDELHEPVGVVFANEIDPRRADMLVHNVMRLGSPSTIVSQMDAQFFPNMVDENGQLLRFDRVLADVPCSGDGTLRKSTCLWSKWVPQDALGLHPRQYILLCRGLDLLKVGGRLVYSTCSLNPIEDEAVVAAVLRRYGDGVVLVPLPPLDGLHGCPGLSTWLVPHPDDASICWESYDQVPNNLRERVRPSAFPASPGSPDAESWARSCCHCQRFLPHRVQGGGFFVAVLQKVFDPAQFRKTASARPQKFPSTGAFEHGNADVASETIAQEDASLAERAAVDSEIDSTRIVSNETADASAGVSGDVCGSKTAVSARALRRREAKAKSFSIGEYIFLDRQSDIWQHIREFYGLPDVLAERLCHRGHCDKKIYYISPSVARILKGQAPMKLRVVHAGVRVLAKISSERADGGPPAWRLAQDGLPTLLQQGLRRRVCVNRRYLERLLRGLEISREELLDGENSGTVQGLDALRIGDDTRLVSGSVAVTLLPEAGDAFSPSIAVACLLSGRCLLAQLPRKEAIALLESFELEAQTAAILEGKAASDGEEATMQDEGDERRRKVEYELPTIQDEKKPADDAKVDYLPATIETVK